MSEDMVGVILAAGRGTRMAPFNKNYPKPTLPICNQPLMAYQIAIMKQSGIRKIYIVIGHLGYEISRTIGDGKDFDVEIHYVEQSDTLGIAHAVGQLEPYINSPFLLFLGDIYFHGNGIRQVMEDYRRSPDGSLIFVKEEDDPEAIKKNFAVIYDPETGRIQRVIEKPRHVKNRMKGCGIYLFDLPIFDAIRRTPRTALRDEYELTDSIQILIDDGEPVTIAKAIENDINLTSPSDLLRVNLYELDNQGLGQLVDATSKVDENSQIRHTVIGPNAEIRGHGTLKDSLVLGNTTVDLNGEVISNHIMTPNLAIDCKAMCYSK